MDKVKVKSVLAKLEVFGKKLGNLLVLVVALVAGGIIGYYYHHFTKTRDVIALDNVRSIKTTSVALNERGELMMIDRSTGKYIIYQDSVGTAIFNMYANKIYMNQVSNK